MIILNHYFTNEQIHPRYFKLLGKNIHRHLTLLNYFLLYY